MKRIVLQIVHAISIIHFVWRHLQVNTHLGLLMWNRFWSCFDDKYLTSLRLIHGHLSGLGNLTHSQAKESKIRKSQSQLGANPKDSVSQLNWASSHSVMQGVFTISPVFFTMWSVTVISAPFSGTAGQAFSGSPETCLLLHWVAGARKRFFVWITSCMSLFIQDRSDSHDHKLWVWVNGWFKQRN